MGKRVRSGKNNAPAAENESSPKLALYLLQLFLCLVPQAVSVILLLTGADSRFAYDLCFVLLPFIAVPLLSVILPFICSERGIHPLLTFFPAGLFMMVNPLYTAVIYRIVSVACAAVSLFSACAGEEKAKRKHANKAGNKKQTGRSNKKQNGIKI